MNLKAHMKTRLLAALAIQMLLVFSIVACGGEGSKTQSEAPPQTSSGEQSKSEPRKASSILYAEAEKSIATIRESIDMFSMMKGKYPTALSELSSSSGEKLPMLDPWGRAWRYEPREDDYYLGCKGENVTNEDDDIFYDSEEGRIINMKDGERRTELESEPDNVRATLDAQQLTKFVQSLLLAASDSSRRKLIKMAAPQSKTFADLIIELYQTKVLTVEDIGYLAGASGTKAAETELKSGKLDPQSSIIFTGPNTGAKLLELLSGKTTDGIALCYNRHHYNRYPESGMVVLFAGDTTPATMSLKDMAAKYNAASGKSISFKSDLAEQDDKFYGKPPFQNVVPE